MKINLITILNGGVVDNFITLNKNKNENILKGR